MTDSDHARDMIGLEQQMLTALCQPRFGGEKREPALRRLSGYRWREPTHQVIFDCLARLPQLSTAALRDYLAACATRKGFPDIDWGQFLEPASSPKFSLEELLKELRNAE